MAQEYGGNWTLIKLEVIKEYFQAYFKVMKNQHFKLCYIDAFAGSGTNQTRVGDVDGSALQALDFPFDKYYFIEKNNEYVGSLYNKIVSEDKYRNKDVKIIHGDCNDVLKVIDQRPLISEYWRGIVFLDPYAMELDWASLETIARTKAFDIWYLFPLSAAIRCLKKNGDVDINIRNTISRLLGTPYWMSSLYKPSPQISLFEDESIIRSEMNDIQNYIMDRFKQSFLSVLDPPLMLRNSINAPLFLLCFACNSGSDSARRISLDIAKSLVRRAKQRENTVR